MCNYLRYARLGKSVMCSPSQAMYHKLPHSNFTLFRHDEIRNTKSERPETRLSATVTKYVSSPLTPVRA